MAQYLKLFISKVPAKNLGNVRNLTLKFTKNKEWIQKSSGSVSQTIPDYLLQDLKNASSTNKILEMVGLHHKIMNNKQLVQALRSLFILQKTGNETTSAKNLINDPKFEMLCSSLRKRCKTVDLSDLVEIVKVLAYVGVNSRSMIFQTMLQLVRHNINDFSLQQIIFLNFVLKHCKSSPLVQALQIALPLVFDLSLQTKLDRENIHQIVECFEFAARKSTISTSVELLVEILHNYLEKYGPISGMLAKSIILSICDMNEDEYFEPILNAVLESFIRDIDNLDYRDVQLIITRLIFKYCQKYPFYYNDVLLDKCANWIIDKDLGVNDALSLLHRFFRVSYACEKLLNYVTKKCAEDETIIANATPLDLYILTVSAASIDNKPVHWDIVKNVLLQTDCFTHYNKGDIIKLKLITSLCALDIYKPNLLTTIFHENSIEKIRKSHFASDFENFLQIYQAVHTFKPELRYMLPNEAVVLSVADLLRHDEEYSVKGALQAAVGGEEYIKTSVKTKLGHYIDHVLVIDKNTKEPLEVDIESEYLEDFEVGDCGQIYAIIVLPQFHYTINTKTLKLSTRLGIRALEANTYTVVPINLELWQSLPEFERIPFIQHSLQQKSEDRLKLANVN